MLFWSAAMVAIWAVSAVIGVIARLAFGDLTPLSIGGLIVVIVGQLLSAVISVILLVMLARLYSQRAGAAAAQASVPEQRDLRGAIARQDAEQARVGKALDRALEWSEPRAAIGVERRRMIERAGMDVDTAHVFAPGTAATLRREATGRGQSLIAAELGR